MSSSKRYNSILSTIVSILLVLAVGYAISLIHWILGIIVVLIFLLLLLHNTRQDDK